MDRLAELIRQAHEGDKSARDRLVSDNLGLVHLVTRRFENRGHEREELFQIGCIGLMKAIDKFDLSMQVAFSTYAVPLITGEIRRFLRDDGMVRVSRSLKENGYKVSRAREWLSGELGRDPTLLEISAVTELPVEEIVLAMEANREVESIYQPVCGSDGDELCLIDQIGGRDADYREEPEKEAVLNRMVVEQMLEGLNQSERELICLRYFEGKTQCEVAAALGMTQVQVSRLEKKLLYRMRESLKE
ncbi:MAG: SigB/SigF/SigG family RNA polymerase sigma factor [Roseburia sp.]